MKKSTLIPLIAVGMLTSSANAVIKSNWSTAQSDKTPSVDYEEVKAGDVTELQSGQRVECNDGKNIPLGLLKAIMPNFDQIKVDFETKNKKSARIEIPQYMKSCMKLKFNYHQVGNDIYISATNEEDLAGYPGKNTNEKYENCLKETGALKSDGSIDESKAVFSGGFTQPFSVKLDPSQNMNVQFSSPQALGTTYGTAAGGDFLETSHDECFKGEEIVAGGLSLFHSPLVASVEHYQKICEDSDPNAIFKAFKELSTSDTGNAQALDSSVRDILKAGLKQKLQDTVDVKQKEWEEALEELGKELKKADDEETVKELTKQYLDKIKEIEKFIVDRKIYDLKEAYEKRRKTKNKDDRRALDKEIKKLNEEIGLYARKSNFVSNAIINKMLEFGLKDEADEAFEFKLKSAHWAQVNFGPKREGYPKDPKGVGKAISSKAREFDRISTDKEKEYDAKQGYDTYSKDYANIAQQLMNKRQMSASRDQDRMQDAYKDIQKYCAQTFWGGTKNKSKCTKAQQSYMRTQKSATSRYNKYNQDIMYYSNQANKFYSIEQQYTDSLRVESTDPYGYDGYDDFSLFLGGDYSGGMGYENYGNFSMTGQAGMMPMPGMQTMGQNGMPQYMQNPYGQQQQMQMQMPMSMPIMTNPLNSGGQMQQAMPYSNTPTYTMPTGR